MRQMTLGVQLKERATFASFLTARNVELVAHLHHVAATTPAGSHLDRGPAYRGQVASAAGGVRGHAGRKARRLSSARVAAAVRSRRRSRARSSSTSPVMTTCNRSPDSRTGSAACFRCGSARSSAIRRCCSRRAKTPPRCHSVSRTSSRAWRHPRCSRCASSTTRNRSRRCICARNLRGFELPPETARYLQRRFPRDMRTLCEILDTLDDAAFAAQRRITVPFIRDVIDGAAKA